MRRGMRGLIVVGALAVMPAAGLAQTYPLTVKNQCSYPVYVRGADENGNNLLLPDNTMLAAGTGMATYELAAPWSGGRVYGCWNDVGSQTQGVTLEMNCGWVELTLNSAAGNIFSNITYVDYLAIPMGIEAQGGSACSATSVRTYFDESLVQKHCPTKLAPSVTSPTNDKACMSAYLYCTSADVDPSDPLCTALDALIGQCTSDATLYPGCNAGLSTTTSDVYGCVAPTFWSTVAGNITTAGAVTAGATAIPVSGNRPPLGFQSPSGTAYFSPAALPVAPFTYTGTGATSFTGVSGVSASWPAGTAVIGAPAGQAYCMALNRGILGSWNNQDNPASFYPVGGTYNVYGAFVHGLRGVGPVFALSYDDYPSTLNEGGYVNCASSTGYTVTFCSRATLAKVSGVKGAARGVGGAVDRDHFKLSGRFDPQEEIDLRRESVRLEALMTALAPAGQELVSAPGTGLSILPARLGRQRGAQRDKATFETAPGVVPHARLAIERKRPGEGFVFALIADDVGIDAAPLCGTGPGSLVPLRTKFTLERAGVDVEHEGAWDCGKGRIYRVGE